MTGTGLIFIANPFAMRGKGAKYIAQLEEELKRRCVAYTLLRTERRLHAMELAREAAETHPDATIVAVGGDGTVNEVANGILGRGPTLGIIPVGSGNDFVKSVGIDAHSVVAALEILLAGKTFLVDVGKVSVGEGERPAGVRIFMNGIGIGFDGYIAARTLRYKRLRGWWLYLVSFLRTVAVFRTPDMVVRVPGVEIHSPHLLVSIGNGHSSGGKFLLTPDAVVDDGQLDICLVDDLSTARILRVFPSVFKGTHDRFPEVHFLRAPTIEVVGARGLYVHADGELLSQGEFNRFEVVTLPQSLRVIGKEIHRPSRQRSIGSRGRSRSQGNHPAAGLSFDDDRVRD